MKVLVACEESQTVCVAFRERGHEAYSNDIIDCSGGHPEWHLKMDAFEAIKLMDWDLMIAHPPCTFLAVSGARWMYHPKYPNRLADQNEGADFFLKLLNSGIEKICVENPVGVMSTRYRKPDQIIQPYNFGDPFQKTTCLWLKNLSPLVIEDYDAPLFGKIVDRGEMHITKSGKKMAAWFALLPSNENRAKIRSKTFPGIARAMAEQWGNL